MKAEDASFLNLLGGGFRQSVIPVFERQYSWTEALLADVVRVAPSPQGATHFVRSVVYVASSDHSAVLPQWLVIDGQQGLTNWTVLLAVLRNRVKIREGQIPVTDSPAAFDAPDWIVEVLPRAEGFTSRQAHSNSTVSGSSLYTVWSPAQLTVARALAASTCQLLFEPT